jgi:hypothetical protein
MVPGAYLSPIEPDPLEIAGRLTATTPRGACSDGERRAAVLLRDLLRRSGRPARIETAWVRPAWPAAYVLLCLLGVGGSLAAISWPAVGLGVLLATFVLLAGDLTGRLPLVRLLLPRRATAIVVSEPPPRPAALADPRVRLIVTAPIDAGRGGLIHRLAPFEARLRRKLGGHLPTAPALLCFCLLVDAAAAAARLTADDAGWPSLVALVPTIVLLLGAGAYLDIALADVTPGANIHASAAAAAVALTAALDQDPPRRLAVELVLTGAAEGGDLGMRAYVNRRRRGARPEELAVLALGPCGAGTVRFHVTEGRLLPQRMHPTLVALAARQPGGRPHRRGQTNAAVARRAGWPAIGLSTADEREHPGAGHRAGDGTRNLERASIEQTIVYATGMIRELDRQLENGDAT